MIKKIVRRVNRLYKTLRYRYRLDSEKYHLEIHVVDHCNLKCNGCSHFAPIADEWYISLEDFEKQMKMAAPLFSGHIKELRILGGEPLLHPQIARIVEIARDYFREDKVVIVTNGLLIKSMDDMFWKEVTQNNIVLYLTKYPFVNNFDDIVDYIKKKNALVKTHAIKSDFLHRGMSEKGNNNWIKSYYRCSVGGYYIQLRDSKVYPCDLMAYVDILNKKYGTHFTVDQSSYLELGKVKNAKEITKFRRTAKKVCRYCNMDCRVKYAWGFSKCEKKEWIIDE